MTDKIVVFCNCSSEEEARQVSRGLVESRVAACVSILPKVHSIYHWQDKIEEADEWTLLIKTTRGLFDRLSAELRRLHSYQVPEVLAVPVLDGLGDYLDWIDRETVNSEGRV